MTLAYADRVTEPHQILVNADGVPLPDETQEAFRKNNPFERIQYLGLLVERFATLESIVRYITRGLILDPIAAHTLTQAANISQLLAIAQPILEECKRRNEPRAPEGLTAALTSVQPLLNQRNNLFHNPPVPGDGRWDYEVWRYTRKSNDPQVIPANLDDLKRLYDEVNDVMNALTKNPSRRTTS